jgi:hypothetical protein
MSETITCTGCRQKKLSDEFIGFGVKSNIKQYQTCNNCRTRNTKQKEKTTKKRQLEVDSETNEIIEVTDLYDYTAQFLNLYSIQMENSNGNDKENIIPFCFKCQVDISTLDNSEKEIANTLVECIEEADDFAWK